MEPNPYLVFSSIFLFLPAIPLYMKDEYVGTGLSVLCCIFSMLHHSTKPRYPIILFFDKVFAYSTCIYATFTCIEGLPYSIIPYTTLISCAYTLYHVGYIYKCFLWHSNYSIATGWHILLHVGNGILCTVLVLLSDKSLYNRLSTQQVLT